MAIFAFATMDEISALRDMLDLALMTQPAQPGDQVVVVRSTAGDVPAPGPRIGVRGTGQSKDGQAADGRAKDIHIQQLLRWKNQHGAMGRRDFRGAVIDLFEAAGFVYSGEAVIPKNPQAMAQRLNLHCLMFETGRRNARNLKPAPNDMVIFFQKPGECETPVPALFDAKKNPEGWVSQEEWISWASGVWGDIRETDVLEGWKSAREKDEEKHVCPLQLEVIRRCIKLFTNPGETVLDPFMGIGSTAWVALEQGRDVVGFELKESYWRQALRNVDKKQLELDEQGRDLVSMMEAAE